MMDLRGAFQWPAGVAGAPLRAWRDRPRGRIRRDIRGRRDDLLDVDCIEAQLGDLGPDVADLIMPDA